MRLNGYKGSEYSTTSRYESEISTMVVPSSGIVRGDGKGSLVEKCIHIGIVNPQSFASNVAMATDIGFDLGEGQLDGIVVG
jgi:hypothetical protein